MNIKDEVESEIWEIEERAGDIPAAARAVADAYADDPDEAWSFLSRARGAADVLLIYLEMAKAAAKGEPCGP